VNASCARIWIDTTDLGCIAIASDGRLKQDFQPFAGSALSSVNKLSPGTFRWQVGDDRTTRQPAYARKTSRRSSDPRAEQRHGDAGNADGMLQVDYIGLIPILVRTFKS
jgi:hypothetical protein